MEFNNSKREITVTNNFGSETSFVYNRELFVDNIEKALDILERTMLIDYTSVKIQTSLDTNKYKVVLSLKGSGLEFSNTSKDENTNLEWTEFDPEQNAAIAEAVIIMLINSWLEEAGLPTVEIDTPDSELSMEQKRCIIAGIVEHYTEETLPELADAEVTEILKNFGFNFDYKGDIINDDSE